MYVGRVRELLVGMFAKVCQQRLAFITGWRKSRCMFVVGQTPIAHFPFR